MPSLARVWGCANPLYDSEGKAECTIKKQVRGQGRWLGGPEEGVRAAVKIGAFGTLLGVLACLCVLRIGSLPTEHKLRGVQ